MSVALIGSPKIHLLYFLGTNQWRRARKGAVTSPQFSLEHLCGQFELMVRGESAHGEGPDSEHIAVKRGISYCFTVEVLYRVGFP